ncbi:MAG: nuclear transport factor 2 family protein [Gemmatimonadaceae bacterium]
MRQSIILCLALVAIACNKQADSNAAAPPPAALSAAELDSVKAVDAAFATAMNASDTAAALAIYANDARFMPPDSPVLDKAATAKLLVAFLAAGASDFVLTPTTVSGSGDLAYIVGTVSYRMKGAAVTDKYAEVLRKGADGKWRYEVDMFSGVTPPAPTPPAK